MRPDHAGQVTNVSDEHESASTHTRIRVAAPAVERREIGHYLVLLEGAEPGRRILLESRWLAIGRDAGCEVVLADQDVSRLHARIRVTDDRVLVEDQRSTNGTFVNGHLIEGPTVLGEGSLLALGQQVLKLERRSRREVERAEQITRDLDRASQYVRSLLPDPLIDGPIRTDWLFQPSALLGGDAFGYDRLDDDTFVIYLLDVSGHGAGAAMHSVSVLSVLRQRALPAADLCEPAEVLSSLNTMFQMERHDGMFFTMWYGVYRVSQRTLRYACAGHHPSYLLSPDGTDGRIARALGTRGLMIGATPDARFRVEQTVVPTGSSLYLFSDGVFEIVTRSQQQWRLKDFTPLLDQPGDHGAAPVTESQRLYKAIKAAARPGPLDDDFSLLVVTFT